MKNKRGISAVIITLILVVLAIVMVAIVWSVISNMAKGSMDESQSCFSIINKIKFNQQYVCYNTTSGSGIGKSLKFSINRGDIELNKIIIMISSSGASIGLEIPETINNANLMYYNYSSANVELPAKNSGVGYVYNGTEVQNGKPDSIILYPVVNEKQCEAMDEITEFINCQ